MRVLAACSLGGAGHLQPLVPLLDAARKIGHETVVIAPPAMAAQVEATGHVLVPGGEPSESEIAAIRERLPLAPPAEASVLGNRELFGRMATAAMLPAMHQVIEQWRPDLVVREPCEYASAVVAASSGVPVCQVAIDLAGVEWRSMDTASPALERHRKGLTDEARQTTYLSRFPAAIDPSLFPDTRRYADLTSASGRTLPDWWSGSDAPLVYVTLGTVIGHMSIAAEAYRTMLAAIEEIDARVLLTVGRHFDASVLGEPPGNVHVESWVDQADVLVDADLVVCHGGSGTTFGALAAGVPVVVVPVFGGQVTNGAGVAAAGAGIVVDTTSGSGARRPLRTDDRERVRAAIDEVRSDRRYRERARAIADEMADHPPVETVLDDLLSGR
jgi:UDP:flavonoid glycosyltransferase YjiC (YdhE family)